MRCPGCHYHSKSKPIKCPVCGHIFRAVVINKFEHKTDPDFVPPSKKIKPPPDAITPKEVYYEERGGQRRHGGGGFGGSIIGSILSDLLGGFMDDDDFYGQDEQYAVMLDDFGNVLHLDVFDRDFITIKKYTEHKDEGKK